MNEILRAIRALVERKRYFDYGEVLAFDEKNYTARVRLASGAETDWLRVATPFSGDGYGFFLPLTPGDEVVVFFPTGEPGTGGFVGWRLWGKDSPPSGGAREIVIKHASGAVIRIAEDGSVVMDCPRVDIGQGADGGVLTDATLPACLFTGGPMSAFSSKTVRAKR